MPYLILVSAVWAFSFPLIKGTLVGLDASFVSFVRMGLSLVVFLPFLRIRKVAPALRLRLAGIGAVQFGLMYVAYISAYRYLPAHMIVLLTTTTPLFVTLLNDISTRRFHRLFLVSAALAVAAGVVIKYPAQPMSANLAGVALLQVSNLAFAFGQLAYKKLAARHGGWRDRDVFGLLYIGAAAVTAVSCAFAADIHTLRLSGTQSAVLLYLGVVASGLCFFLWNVGSRRVNEGTLAVMNNLKIPLGIVASLMLLHEGTDYARLAAGCTLMLAALWLNRRANSAWA
jgi:drug/metabolite transporter (DMT)-like permease